MTIEEFIEDLRTQISEGKYTIDRREVLRNLEEELEGALVIPKGWELNEAGSWDTTHWVQLWNKKEEVLFTGKSDDNYDEALRNALEQITTK